MPGAEMTGVLSLIETLDDIKDRWGVGTVSWEIGTNVEYAVYVAFGTSRMAARPYLRPALEEAARKLDVFAAQANSLEALVRDIALYVEKRAKGILTEKDAVDTGNLRGSVEARPAKGGASIASASFSA
ncbi:hypothetical protein [Halomarina oriensis]|uniref:Uncharacterized protein n=1 Tax=Halomarina oriensis TaxID=671145 RepID=A0A6B0GJ68_9EURY|nr:hypothetical protein [Halomarina oriensis]MWG34824.1 hypothetical protein [Halomarina oriensis]